MKRNKRNADQAFADAHTDELWTTPNQAPRATRSGATVFSACIFLIAFALVLVLLSGRHAYKAISQYGFSSWLDTQLDSPVYMVLTVLIVAGLLASGIAGMISVRREGKKIEELKRRRMIEE